MRVAELIEMLENENPDATVRAVQQPNYPLVADFKEEWENGISARRDTVYLHLTDAYDYYGGEEE